MAINSEQTISEVRTVSQRTAQINIRSPLGEYPMIVAQREEVELSGNELKSRRDLPPVVKTLIPGSGQTVTLESGTVLLIDEIAEGVSLAIDLWSQS